ncbi:sugar phosphate nucleotidyltransferase [uncultured Dokdonia sp.]|uniref:sugar phosphate nucleotidyltransferase n=1 Tax=uncultured Dokdonia sp. TaxID=575653 RepID=UPI00260B77A6|nr:sugar phosphate nucleotidyltransferase [uncultured Dokdonia sp.]
MTNNLIILAGGTSSRMKKSTASALSEEMVTQANTRSKALILLNDRPMLDYVLYNAKQAGITNVIIVIHPKGGLFKEYYGLKDQGNDFHGLTISYAVQHITEGREKPLGTADALVQAMDQYPRLKTDSFLVCNSDNLYSTKAFFALRENKNAHAFLNYDRNALKYPMERIARFALTKTDAKVYLQAIIEKPDTSSIEDYKNPDGTFRVSMNIFKFEGATFYPYLLACPMHPERLEKELPTAILAMIKDHPKAMQAIPFAEHVPDLTGKDDIFILNAYLSTHIPTLDWDQ